ncbi:MAG: ankyrin repeat domain-containing protein [Candidatus Aminicenantes bacterium]|nr:ankyrin repeat domain-containing protein [Candidatus Aminicenantes bacterium]
MKSKKQIGCALGLIASLFLIAPADELHDAASKGDLRKVSEILETNPEPANQKDTVFGRTPLHWAARGVHLDVLGLLLEKGADPNARDNSGITALHSVSARGHREAATLLIAKGANVNAMDGFGRTPLAYALSGGHRELAAFLSSKGGTVPIQGEAGRRLLHESAFQGDKSLVEWMISAGVDVSTANGNGGNLVHSISEGGLADLAGALIKKGLAVNGQDRYGFSPLHFAARNGLHDVADVLLRNHADINAVNAAGETPLHLARRAGKNDMVEMLVARGAGKAAPRFPALKGEYLGQKEPGTRPEIFARGIISSVDHEHSAPAFSPDNREVFWTSISDGMKIFRMRLEKGRWTAPERAPFTGFDDCYPWFSADGKRLYYVSYRPLHEGEKNAGMGINLWLVERTKRGWSAPRPVGPPFNTGNVFGFSMSDNGTIYYSDASRGFDIFRSRLVNGRFAKPEALGDAVNSEGMEDEPFIAPDESYLIFKSLRPGGFGGADLYISWRRKDGSWTEAMNLGPQVNTEHAERFPSVSRDGKYFFFGSDRNGNRGDIYWMKADFLRELKAEPSGWRTVTSPVREGLHRVFFVDDDLGWAVTYGTGTVIHTQDGGKSWQIQAKLKAEYFEAIQFLDKMNGWLCGDYGYVYKTTDGGESWIDVSPSVPGRIVEPFRSDPVRSQSPPDGWFVAYYPMVFYTPDEGFVGGFMFNPAQKGSRTRVELVFETRDGGRTWERKDVALKEYLARLEFSDRLNRNRRMIGDIFYLDAATGWKFAGQNVIQKTTNAGREWQPYPITQEKVWFWRGMAFQDKNVGYAIGELSRESARGVLYQTADGGARWIKIEIDWPALHAITLSPSRIFIVGKEGTILMRKQSPR